MTTRLLLLLASSLALTACGAADGSNDADPADRSTPAAFNKAPGSQDQGPQDLGTQDSGTQDSGTVAANPTAVTAGFYSLSTNSLDGKPVQLADYQGKVTLVVNVASECGYTRQYAGLQKLHAEMKDRGFAVLGFPSNEFGGQEPGTPEQIREFCTSKFGVDFPMFAKVETKPGASQSPIYRALTSASGKQPKWNFCKYLVGKQGEVLGFYPSGTAPDSAELKKAIDAALQ